jgi:hypothetical protein
MTVNSIRPGLFSLVQYLESLVRVTLSWPRISVLSRLLGNNGATAVCTVPQNNRGLVCSLRRSWCTRLYVPRCSFYGIHSPLPFKLLYVIFSSVSFVRIPYLLTSISFGCVAGNRHILAEMRASPQLCSSLTLFHISRALQFTLSNTDCQQGVGVSSLLAATHNVFLISVVFVW